MRRARFCAILVTLALAPALHAQTPDSIAWRRYFPLAVGNSWEYLNEYDEGMGPNFGRPFFFTERYRVVARHIRSADTLFALSFHITEATGRRPERRDTVWVRYDAQRKNAVDVDAPCSTVAPVSFASDLWVNARPVPASPFPVRFVAKEVSTLSGRWSRWVADVGMLKGGGGYDGCSSPLCGSNDWRLIRATVGGVSYEVGQTSVEAERAGVASGLMTLHPSVARTSAMLHLNAPAQFDAFDATGRRVYRADAPAGDHVLDVSAWPPGLYLVRAGRETRRLIVPR